MTADGMAFGARLRASRQSAGLSQEELAHKSGVSVRTIGNLERGRDRWPYRDTVLRLADALQLCDAARADFIAASSRRLGPRPAGNDGSPVPQVTQDRHPQAPRQLPAIIRHFVGRNAELAALTGLLTDSGGAPSAVVISAIGGTAGVGKTALAVQWGHLVADRFPDGQLYVNLHGFDPDASPVDPQAAVRRILDALAVHPGSIPADVDAQFGLYRSLMAGKRILLVLDNARDSRQVRPLIPGAAGCVVLVTSRNQLHDLIALDGALPLSVGLFTHDEARRLLAMRLGSDRVGRESSGVDELIELCAGLPLALNIAVARAAARPGATLGSMAAELREARRRLDVLSAGQGAADLRAVFTCSFDALDGDSARMFRLLGLHPGAAISVPAAASLAGVETARARHSLEVLTSAHLAIERTPGRYGLHDLLRAYAVERAHLDDSGDERHAALTRLFDHYLHTAQAADAAMSPVRWTVLVKEPLAGASPQEFSGKDQAHAWFDAERLVLLELLAGAANYGFDAHCWHLAWILRRYLYTRGYLQDLAATHRTALVAARRLGDREGQAHIHLGLGRACTYLADYQEATWHLDQALDLFREIEYPAGEGNTHIAIGYLMECQQRYPESLASTQQAIDLSEAYPDDLEMRFVRKNALNNSGWIYAHVGRFPEARARSEEAIALSRQTGDSEGVATALDNLGFIYSRLGDHRKAIACFRQCLEILTAQGNRYTVAEILGHLAQACQAAGDLTEARAVLERALGIARELDLPEAAALSAKLRDLGIGEA